MQLRRIRSLSLPNQKGNCYGCGSASHLANSENCSARKATCKLCGKVGHYQRVCKSNKVNAVDETPDASEEIFAQQGKAPRYDVTINGLTVKCIADTSAAVNVMQKHLFEDADWKPTVTNLSTHGRFPYTQQVNAASTSNVVRSRIVYL